MKINNMKIKTSVLIIAIIINIILSLCILHKINVKQSKPVVNMCYVQETIEQAEERLQMCIAR